jgi:hypothetical protein
VSSAPTRCLYAYRPEQRPDCRLAATLLYGTRALCSNCNQQRSTLGKGLVPRRLPVTEPDPLGLLADAYHQVARATEQLTAAVIRARQHDITWPAIATVLGTTRQAAQQRFTRP